MNMNIRDEKEELIMKEKKTIIDLVNRIKYEVTEEQLAELAGCATPLSKAEFVDWEARIDDLDLSKGPSWTRGEVAAQLREFLHRVLGRTYKVGGRAVAVGKRIVKFVLSLLDRYPITLAAAVVMAALCFVVASVPYLGVVLLPVAKLAGVCVVGMIAFGESLHNLDAAVVIR